MTVNWLGTWCGVVLLYCWREAYFQPLNRTSDLTTETPSSARNQDMPGVFDEILVQEILDPNKTKSAETQTTAATVPMKTVQEKNSGIDENYQADSSENYHELLEHIQFSSGNEDRNSNNEASTGENAHVGAAEDSRKPQLSAGGRHRQAQS
ncbi:sperm acrosome-associated protein 7 isoform X2 [Oryctolagus cuniculus]|uniref:sperm acrosome-associated protein 7 isoform X2 n=1 Tax=Oryctolagus cuniculus TaxID=9986 RepID=UPI00387A1566